MGPETWVREMWPRVTNATANWEFMMTTGFGVILLGSLLFMMSSAVTYSVGVMMIKVTNIEETMQEFLVNTTAPATDGDENNNEAFDKYFLDRSVSLEERLLTLNDWLQRGLVSPACYNRIRPKLLNEFILNIDKSKKEN